MMLEAYTAVTAARAKPRIRGSFATCCLLALLLLTCNQIPDPAPARRLEVAPCPSQIHGISFLEFMRHVRQDTIGDDELANEHYEAVGQGLQRGEVTD